MEKIFTLQETNSIGDQADISWVKYRFEQSGTGADADYEINTSEKINNFMTIGKIEMPLLNEFQDNYEHPGKIENRQTESPKLNIKRYVIDATIDSIVDSPFTETYQSDYKENRRENNKLILDD